jgi:CBS domain containing-hemolysin-like protein
MKQTTPDGAALRQAAKTGALIALFAAQPAFAFSGGLEDRLADIISTIVLIFVPIGGVVLFWKVHILPEVAAEKRHHPQKEAIKVLCIMSLLFGGLLWPFAWLWAYMKPVGYQAAYGRDKHDDYYAEQAATAAEQTPAPSGAVDADALRREIASLQSRLAAVEATPSAKATLPPAL